MVARIVATSIFVFIAYLGNGRADGRNLLSGQQAARLAKSLNHKNDDSTRFKVLIRLSKYMFEKGINGDKERDSVASMIRTAKEINSTRLSGSKTILVRLYEATLLRRSGDPDSARQLLVNLVSLSHFPSRSLQAVEAFLELSRTYNFSDRTYGQRVRDHIDSVFSIVPKLILPSELDSCMATLKNFFLFQMDTDDLATRLYFLDKFNRTCRLLNDKSREFWARREMGYVYYQQGSLNKAISTLLEVAREQKDGGYPHICYTYDRLSFYYYIATDYEKALSYGLEAVKNVRNAIDSGYLGQFYSTVAVSHRQRGETEEAVTWSLKAIDFMNVSKEYNDMYLTLSDLVRDLLPLKRQQEALHILLQNSRKNPPHLMWEKVEFLISLSLVYEALQNRAAAERHVEVLARFIDDLVRKKAITGDARSYQHLATYYLNTGRNDRAELYFRKTMQEWPKSAETQRKEYEHKFLFRLDSARGNFHSAIEHMRTWHRILDSALSARKAQQFDEIKVAYQTEQKDSLINLKEQNIQLLTKQDQLQKNQLKQGVVLRNISLAAVGLSVIIIALLYNSYRLKKRSAKKLETKQAEIEQQNTTLHRLVNEKDWLVKEIHHRVKNNLQIIMSLLNSQSAYIESEPALKAIHDSQHRVQAMSLIHQKLYSTDNVSSIDMNLYIRELASYLSESFNIARQIRFEFDLDSLEMDVTHAVPLGLILNEAITNSIKYAFPGNACGTISITLKRAADSHFVLTISDDGVGIPSAINRQRPGSLGLNLIAGLTEDISGRYSIENKNGTVTTIYFEPDFDNHKMN